MKAQLQPKHGGNETKCTVCDNEAEGHVLFEGKIVLFCKEHAPDYWDPN